MSSPEIEYVFAKSTQELEQILSLQAQNLKQNINQVEAKEQGFVTLEHDLDLLQRMNQPYPHVIAKFEDQVVGYSLVMLRSLCNEIPLLIPMFDQINSTAYQDGYLSDLNYFVMGQVCISKDFRSKGIFQGLYKTLAEAMSKHFDYIITEIAVRNTRSTRAHQKVGFEIIHEYQDEYGTDWLIVLLKI